MYLQSAAASYIYIHYALKKSGDVTCSCSAHRPHLFRPYPNVSLMRRANTAIPPNKPRTEHRTSFVTMFCSGCCPHCSVTIFCYKCGRALRQSNISNVRTFEMDVEVTAPN